MLPCDLAAYVQKASGLSDKACSRRAEVRAHAWGSTVGVQGLRTCWKHHASGSSSEVWGGPSVCKH
jgi:hypothetical protein